MSEELNMRNECYSCKFKREIPGDEHIKCIKPVGKMKANPHGIKSGWFNYPYNFDPVWKEQLCENFEEEL